MNPEWNFELPIIPQYIPPHTIPNAFGYEDGADESKRLQAETCFPYKLKAEKYHYTLFPSRLDIALHAQLSMRQTTSARNSRATCETSASLNKHALHEPQECKPPLGGPPAQAPRPKRCPASHFVTEYHRIPQNILRHTELILHDGELQLVLTSVNFNSY